MLCHGQHSHCVTKKLPDQVCVFDMTTLRVVITPGATPVLEVLTPHNELLVSMPVSEVRPGAMLLEAFDQVLAEAVVMRETTSGDVRRHSIALLNPFTSEIAVRALPRTLAFSFDGPITTAGITAELTESTLNINGVAIPAREMARRDLLTAAAAHSA